MSRFSIRENKLIEKGEIMMNKRKLNRKQKSRRVIDENEEYKKCKYCISYNNGKCPPSACPYLLERVGFGQVKYKHFIRADFTEYHDPYFNKRLDNQLKSFCGDLFSSPAHKARFHKVFDMQAIPITERTASYIATIFLLTVDNIMWTMCQNGVYTNSFDFKQMNIVDIHTDGYALYQVSKKIDEGKSYRNIEEFGDGDLITDSTFKAIINAILIAKYGLDFFDLNQ